MTAHATVTGERETHAFPGEAGLTANIVRFARRLRSHGIRVPLSALLDALLSLDLVGVSQPRIVYEVLRCHFVCRREDWFLFDQLFRRFWLDHLPEPPGPPSASDIAGGEDLPARRAAHEIRGASRNGRDAPISPSRMSQTALSYSPHPHPQKKVLNGFSIAESEKLYESISKLVAGLPRRRRIRYRHTIHGHRICLRRILRKNMQYGGELIRLDFKQKKRKKRRIVFFCDVSGSMDIYTLMALQFVHALKKVETRTEIFFFSTALTGMPKAFGAKDFTEAVSRLPHLVADWGGGTRIGRCLQAFNDHYQTGRSLKDVIAIIFSDGWDRGEIDLLREQMARLKRRTDKVIWLNPLIGTKDYRPICRGMRTALPFVDLFLPAAGLHDLEMVERTIEKIW